MRSVYHIKHVPIIQPVSITALQGGNYNFISLKDYLYAEILIATGVLTSTASAVTLQQAKNVEGNGAKSFSFAKMWRNIPASSPQDEQDLWQEIDVSSDTFNVASNVNYRIPIDPAELDVDNDFDCIRPHLSAPGTSLLVYVSALLYLPRYAGLGKKVMHSAKVNRVGT